MTEEDKQKYAESLEKFARKSSNLGRKSSLKSKGATMTGMFVLESPYKVPLILMLLSGCRPIEAVQIMKLKANGKDLSFVKQKHPKKPNAKIETIILDGKHTKTGHSYTWGMQSAESKTMYEKLLHQRKFGWMT